MTKLMTKSIVLQGKDMVLLLFHADTRLIKVFVLTNTPNFSQCSSLEGNCFIHKSIFHGVNFHADGPVMKKKTIDWDKSFEKMTVSKEVLRGDVTMFLMLEGGGSHRCQFHSTYK